MIGTIYEHGSFVFFIYVCLSLLLGLFGLSEVGPGGFWKGLLTIAFEVTVGAGVTILFIDRFNAHWERESLKRRLIREAGSRSHDVAISAVEWMDREGWLRGEDGLLKGANLREARLPDARLEGANLEGANLEQADLRGAKLNGGNLRGANLDDADFRGRAELKGADLQCAKMNSARLEKAWLRDAVLEGAKMNFADLREAGLTNANLKGVSLIDADLSGTSVVETNFKGANLLGAKLKAASYLKSANLEGTRLPFVDLRGVDLGGCNLEGAKLESADLRDATLDGANLRRADLIGALLQGMKFRFEDLTFHGTVGKRPGDPNPQHTEDVFPKTDWVGARLPDGTLYTDETDNDDIVRFVDRRHDDFESTLAKVMAFRKSMGVRDGEDTV